MYNIGMEKPTTITFSYKTTYGIDSKIDYTINTDCSSIDEMCKGFENFLLCCGYRLPHNKYIGVVEKESQLVDGYLKLTTNTTLING
jgi:hypothetical protein